MAAVTHSILDRHVVVALKHAHPSNDRSARTHALPCVVDVSAARGAVRALSPVAGRASLSVAAGHIIRERAHLPAPSAADQRTRSNSTSSGAYPRPAPQSPHPVTSSSGQRRAWQAVADGGFGWALTMRQSISRDVSTQPISGPSRTASRARLLPGIESPRTKEAADECNAERQRKERVNQRGHHQQREGYQDGGHSGGSGVGCGGDGPLQCDQRMRHSPVHRVLLEQWLPVGVRNVTTDQRGVLQFEERQQFELECVKPVAVYARELAGVRPVDELRLRHVVVGLRGLANSRADFMQHRVDDLVCGGGARTQLAPIGLVDQQFVDLRIAPNRKVHVEPASEVHGQLRVQPCTLSVTGAAGIATFSGEVEPFDVRQVPMQCGDVFLCAGQREPVVRSLAVLGGGMSGVEPSIVLVGDGMAFVGAGDDLHGLCTSPCRRGVADLALPLRVVGQRQRVMRDRPSSQLHNYVGEAEFDPLVSVGNLRQVGGRRASRRCEIGALADGEPEKVGLEIVHAPTVPAGAFVRKPYDLRVHPISYLEVMKDVFEMRRLALERLIRVKFDGIQQAFASKVGISPSYVTRMLKPPGEAPRKSIGEAMVRKIEDGLGVDLMSFASASGSAIANESQVQPGADLPLDQSAGQERAEMGPSTPPFSIDSEVSQPLRLLPKSQRGTPVKGTISTRADGFCAESLLPNDGASGVVEFSGPDPLAYAVEVLGDGMSPAIKRGRYLVISPGRAREPSEWVFVRMKDGREMVRELTVDKPSHLELVSVNGGVPHTVEMTDVADAWLISAMVGASTFRAMATAEQQSNEDQSEAEQGAPRGGSLVTAVNQELHLEPQYGASPLRGAKSHTFAGGQNKAATAAAKATRATPQHRRTK